MDIELLTWMLFFIGGYAAVLGLLLRKAIWKDPKDPLDGPTG